MLGEWREEGFGNPVVQDIRCPEFEYTVNEVIQGAKYRTIEDVKDAVKVWAISSGTSPRLERRKNVATCVDQMVTLTRSAHSFQYPLLLPRLDLPGIRRMDRLHLQEFAASSCAFICVYEIKYIVYVLCLNVLFN